MVLRAITHSVTAVVSSRRSVASNRLAEGYSLAHRNYAVLPMLGDYMMPQLRLRVTLPLLARRKLRRRIGGLLVGNTAQDGGDAVEARALLIIGGNDVQRRQGCVGGGEHGVAGARVVVPAAMRLQIHRA